MAKFSERTLGNKVCTRGTRDPFKSEERISGQNGKSRKVQTNQGN